MYHKQVIEQVHDSIKASIVLKSSLEGTIALVASPSQVSRQGLSEGLSATNHVTSDLHVTFSDMDQDQEVGKPSPAPSRDLAVSNTRLPRKRKDNTGKPPTDPPTTCIYRTPPPRPYDLYIITPQPDGLGIGARSVTVSTVGLVTGIEKLTEEDLQVTLAVSLHTPDDELRDTLVPINSRWKVKEVLAAADKYADKTGRRYSIEYALIRDINDQQWRADLLGRLLKNRHAHVNLIPLNPTPGSKWTASRKEDERTFVRTLENYGVPVTVRDTRGREIDGACGQLAAAEVTNK